MAILILSDTVVKMKPYRISQRTMRIAKRDGYIVKSAKNRKKKIDVFSAKTKKKLATIGQNGAKDYSIYLRQSKVVADRRRKAYRARHASNKGVAARLGKRLLW